MDKIIQISALVKKHTHKEIKVLAIRQEKEERQVAGELLDALFENWEETPALKFADVYALQKRVAELEDLVKHMKTLLPSSTHKDDIDVELRSLQD